MIRACLYSCQGTESGGHGAAPTGTFCFVPEVVDAVAGTRAQTGTPAPPVLAAGGITNGRQVCTQLTQYDAMNTPSSSVPTVSVSA